MPEYRYTGEDARHYPTLSLDAVPAGEEGGPTVATFDERPAAADGEQLPPAPEGARYVPEDGRWEPVTAAKKKTTAPAAAAAPASAVDGQKEG